jgi:hypothetical protein
MYLDNMDLDSFTRSAKRACAIIIGVDRSFVIRPTFKIGNVFTLPVLDVRKPEGRLVVEILDDRDKLDIRVVVRVEPGDGPMASRPDYKLIFERSILHAPNDDRYPVAILGLDQID